MANGGARPGAGRKAGGKNKATIERELKAAVAVAQTREGVRQLAVAILEELLGDLIRFRGIAEGAASLHRPPSPGDIEKAAQQGVDLASGDWELFGKWYDRAVSTTKDAAGVAYDISKFQSPQVKAVDAPTPPPDPKDLDRRSRKRFGLRVFEGGRPLNSSSDTA
jgi:hypothetical protein